MLRLLALTALLASLLFFVDRVFAQVDTLQRDDGTILYAFRFPDLYGDDLRAMRFVATDSCRLIGAMFVFGTRGMEQWTTGDPALITKVWSSGEDTLPDVELGGDTILFPEFAANIFDLDSTWRASTARFVSVDLSDHNLRFAPETAFHVGYTTDRGTGDSLAILSDDGNPQTYYATEWYNGGFHFMRDSWPGVNLMIRAIVEFTDLRTQVLTPQPGDLALPRAWPNPFNSATTITVTLARSDNLRIAVFDLLGRRVYETTTSRLTPGVHEFIWHPFNCPTGKYFAAVNTATTSAVVPIIFVR